MVQRCLFRNVHVLISQVLKPFSSEKNLQPIMLLEVLCPTFCGLKPACSLCTGVSMCSAKPFNQFLRLV